MLFNSIEYMVFLPIVFTIYWLLRKNMRWQNSILLLASYAFYAWWDWCFLGLLFGMSFLSWFGGKKIANTPEGGGAYVLRKGIAPCVNNCN